MSERRYARLQGGKALPLPLEFCSNEFNLPGNFKELVPGELYACYDETTRTGAIWRRLPVNFWLIYQPCLRDDFFSRLCENAKELYLQDHGAAVEI